MDVNFDGLRKGMIEQYNNLCRKLNESVKDVGWGPELIAVPDEIQPAMDELRGFMSTLACLYQEGSDGFGPLSDIEIEVYKPEGFWGSTPEL